MFWRCITPRPSEPYPSPCYNEGVGNNSGSSNRGGPGGNPQPGFLWKINKDNLPELLQRASQDLLELASIEPCHYADRPDMRPGCEGAASVRYGRIALCASCDERRSLVGEGLAGVNLPVPRAMHLLQVVEAQALFCALGAATVAGHGPEAMGPALVGPVRDCWARCRVSVGPSGSGTSACGEARS